MCHGESFHPSLLPFLFDWWTKRWEIAEEVLMYCTDYTYDTMLMAKCMSAWITSSIKIITKRVVAAYWFKSARIVSCWDLYVCSWAVICQHSWCQHHNQASTTIDWKMVLSCTDSQFMPRTTNYAILYAWTNRLTRFSTCTNLLIQLLLCLNKLLTNTWQQAQLNIKCLDKN